MEHRRTSSTHPAKSKVKQELKSFLIASLVVVAGYLVWTGSAWAFPSEYEAAKRANVKTVNSWLEAQQRGQDGNRFWAASTNKKRLYSIASWEIVSSSSYSVTVLVDSSTKGGIPIRKTWRVDFGLNKQSKIRQLIDLSQ